MDPKDKKGVKALIALVGGLFSLVNPNANAAEAVARGVSFANEVDRVGLIDQIDEFVQDHQPA